MLGVALVERKRRGVTLTSAGHTLLHHARTIQNQIEAMAGDLERARRWFQGAHSSTGKYGGGYTVSS